MHILSCPLPTIGTDQLETFFTNNQNIYYHKKCTGQLCGRPPGIGSFEAAAENSPGQIGQSFVRLWTVCMQRKHLPFTQVERGNEALRTTKRQN